MMLLANSIRPVAFAAAQRPILVVAIDAEEEFDWQSFSPRATSVRNIAQQHLAQAIFDRHKVCPIYLVDYPVADQDAGVRPLAEFLADGRCEIGAQLHPWVNPPVDEEIGHQNSFPGNLPKELELAKLTRLTQRIESSFGVRPQSYRAGRYGFGPNTADILCGLDYRTDLTFLAHTSLRAEGGPDYRPFGPQPFWFGPRQDMLEVPVTIGMPGLLSTIGPFLYGLLNSPLGHRLRAPGLFARAGLLNRVRLSPEGIPIDEAMQVARWLYAQGQRVFVMSYHTSSLLPGNTPYVRTQADRDRLLDWIDQFLSFFLGDFGGVGMCPSMLHAALMSQVGNETALLS